MIPGRLILLLACLVCLLPAQGQNQKDSTRVSVLKEVTVNARTPVMQISGEKRIFNVDPLTVATNVNAFELLKIVPSVSTDFNGTLLLRGNEVSIQVDGKPIPGGNAQAQFFLSQLAANNVKSIEVIANPSSKFDAEGSGGIINIVLTRKKTSGTDITTTFSYGTGNKYTGGITVSNKNNKTRTILGYNYGDNTFLFTRDNQTAVFLGSSRNYLAQYFSVKNKRALHTLRVEEEISFSDQEQVSFFFRFRSRKTGIHTVLHGERFDENKTRQLTSDRPSMQNDKEKDYDYNVKWDRKFNKKQRLVTQFSYNKNPQDEITNVEEFLFDKNGQSLSQWPITERVYKHIPFDRIIIQMDFSRRINDSLALDLGLKITDRKTDNNYGVDQFNHSLAIWENNGKLSNQFYNKERISAGYLNFSGRIRKFNYQAGLRLEGFCLSAHLIKTMENFDKKYLQLFPSFSLQEKISETFSWQFNYSKRTARPAFQSLNPFVGYADRLNLRVGNADLEPERTNSFNLGIVVQDAEQLFSATIFFRRAKNAINQFTYLKDDSVRIQTWRNFGKASNYGIEFNYVYRKAKNLTLNTSAMILHTEINDQGLSTSNAGWTMNYKAIAGYKLLKEIGIQVAGYYYSPSFGPQGKLYSLKYLDFSVQKIFLKNKLQLSATLQDVFNSRRAKFYLETASLAVNSYNKLESRIFYFSINYIFSKSPKNADKDLKLDSRSEDFSF